MNTIKSNLIKSSLRQIQNTNPVLTAINGVMADVKKLENTTKNEFAKYDYVNIDKFLEALNPLCAKHGLIIAPSELMAMFGIKLLHAISLFHLLVGKPWEPPNHTH